MPATGELRTLGPLGDMRSIWDKNNADEVAAAKKQYDDLKAKGYAAFKVKEKGNKGEQIFDFDSELEKIIMVPAIKGG